MAKTRAQRAKLFAAEELKVNKTKNKTVNAAKLQSSKTQINKKQKSDIQVTADLLKLCRPFSICVDRIDGFANSKSNADFVFEHFVLVELMRDFFSICIKSHVHPLYEPKNEALTQK